MLSKLLIAAYVPKCIMYATVDGPLFSLEARGKIGDAVVYFPWKGRHVVRQWLKPTNPKSTLQGYLRATLKAIGKFVKKVGNLNDGDAADCVIYQAATASAPAGQNWNAFLGKGLLDLLQVAGTYKTTAFENILADFGTTLFSDASVAFETNATLLAIEDFAFDYGYTTNIPAAVQLYFGALACYQNSLIGTAPYNTHPSAWSVSDVDSFKEDMTTDA